MEVRPEREERRGGVKPPRVALIQGVEEQEDGHEESVRDEMGTHDEEVGHEELDDDQHEDAGPRRGQALAAEETVDDSDHGQPDGNLEDDQPRRAHGGEDPEGEKAEEPLEVEPLVARGHVGKRLGLPDPARFVVEAAAREISPDVRIGERAGELIQAQAHRPGRSPRARPKEGAPPARRVGVAAHAQGTQRPAPS